MHGEDNRPEEWEVHVVEGAIDEDVFAEVRRDLVFGSSRHVRAFMCGAATARPPPTWLMSGRRTG